MKLNIELLKTITLLYVEDDKSIRDTLSTIFDKMFLKIYLAANGEEGLKVFEEHKNEIDIVVSDINMPRKNGLSMIEDILKIKSVPTILTTAHTDQEYLMNSIDLGIDKYVTKPIKTKSLVVDIEQLVSEHRKIQHKNKVTETLVEKSKVINQERKELKVQVNDIQIQLQLLEALTNTYISTIKTDKNAVIKDVSTKFCNLYGYKKEEIIGKKITTIQDEESSGNEIQKYMLDALHNKKSISAVHNFKTKYGKKLECNMIMTPHFGDDGYVDGYTFYQDLIHI